MSNAPHTACEHRIGDDELLVIVLDKVGRFVYANPAYLAASGYTWEELAGTNASKMMHGDVPAALSQDMAATLGGGSPWTGIIKNQRKNGDFYWVRLNITALRHDGVYAGGLLVHSKCSPEDVAAVEPAYKLFRDKQARHLRLRNGQVLPAGLRGRLRDSDGEVFDQAVAHYAGVIRQRPVSAAMLQRILSDYFAVPLKVESFVGAWYPVPESQRTRLGMGNAALGSSALAGDRVWQRDLRMRLWIGPLDRGRFDDFLPGGQAAKALAKWLALLTGACLEYEVCLSLKPEHVSGVKLDKDGGARLGFDSFVCSRPPQHPRSDTRYGIHTLQ